MIVQFSREFGEFKVGVVYDLPEDEADFHREAGRAFIPEPEPEPEQKPAPAKLKAKK